MDERTIRERFQATLGTPPPQDLERRVLGRLEEVPLRTLPRSAGVMAAAVAVLIVAVLAGPRLAARLQLAHPAIPATTSVGPLAVPDAGRCKLPVIVIGQAGAPPVVGTEAGFVDTRTGAYRLDPSASVSGLPGGGSTGNALKPGQPAAPLQFSPILHRWLPVAGPSVAKDGRSYLWVRMLPEGSNATDYQGGELHRFDVASGSDHTLWTVAGAINIVRWDDSGILVNTVPPRGGAQLWWLVNSATGEASQQPQSVDPQRLTQLPGDSLNGRFGYGTFGTDAQGRTVFRIGSRQAGDPDWVFYESAPGQRVTIYKGTQGDAERFDPFGPFGDSTGIWFGDYDGATLWHWSADSGLTKRTLSGVPTATAGTINPSVGIRPAGPCV